MPNSDLKARQCAEARHRTAKWIGNPPRIVLLFIMVAATLMVGPPARATDTQLFSGGWLDSRGTPLGGVPFGQFTGDALNIYGVSGVATTTPGPAQEHAEAQRLGFIGADFTYYGEVFANPRVEAHLQF